MVDVRTVGDALIYLAALVVALTAIWGAVRVAVVRPFRKFLQREVNAPLVEIRDQLQAYGDLSKRLDDHIAQHHAATVITDATPPGGFRRG